MTPSDPPLVGRLGGPIEGLRFETPTNSGFTGAKGEFTYRPGERIVFLLGATPLGTAVGAARLTLAHLMSRVDGNVDKLMDAGVTNLARLVFALDRSDPADDTTRIPRAVHDVLACRRLDLRHDVSFLTEQGQSTDAFEHDPAISAMFADLHGAGVFGDARPRRLFPAPAARNRLRRNLLGIRRVRDVRIPLGNGSHVFADVFRPESEQPVPVIMNCGVYGKAFNHHSICEDADLVEHEQLEEDYFHGNRHGQVFENHETVDTAVWVPRGYAVVRVDGPGTGRSPGTLAPWGIGSALAFRDAIDWAGEQSWCNGNVGLWGMSYYAVAQHAVASLRPKHLRAMIAIGTDVDLYDEVAYTGGILNEEFFPNWYRGGLVPAVCGELDAIDIVDTLRRSPFRDSDPQAVFGPRAEVFMSPDLSGVDVPVWTVASTSHQGNFHQLGSSEAYLETPTRNKKIDFWEDWFTKSYSSAAVDDFAAFFDHWLKGVDNAIMDRPPVRLEIRTGNGASYVRHEHEWPVARTDYRRWYLDGGGSLAEEPARGQGMVEYSAEVPAAAADGPTLRDATATPMTSFLSAPASQDLVVAGYGRVALWVSSTSSDLDLFVSVHVVDEQGREVDFTGPTTMGFRFAPYPLTKGWLKVSHRALDRARSTDYAPKHTHLVADHAPLATGEVVPVEIELIPNTGLVRAGQRLRLDVRPYDGPADGMRHTYDAATHDGARNRLHFGAERVAYVQLPILPDAGDAGT